jgi:TetR/AcrR family transcriptional regulator
MGIAERREREKLQRQQDILNAAEKIIFSKGLNHATMDEVAEEAELSKGTLYLYFKSKEEVYLAITHRGLIILGSMFREAVKVHVSGLEKVFRLGMAFYHFSRQYPDHFNALSYYELKNTEEIENWETVQACSCAGQQVLEILIGAIAEGIKDHSIRPEIDPSRMALVLWGMTAGIIQLVIQKGEHLSEAHAFDLNGIVEESFQVFRCALENKG